MSIRPARPGLASIAAGGATRGTSGTSRSGMRAGSPRCSRYDEPRIWDRDDIDAPSSVIVDAEPRHVLYQANGAPLIRPIGFKP